MTDPLFLMVMGVDHAAANLSDLFKGVIVVALNIDHDPRNRRFNDFCVRPPSAATNNEIADTTVFVCMNTAFKKSL